MATKPKPKTKAQQLYEVLDAQQQLLHSFFVVVNANSTGVHVEEKTLLKLKAELNNVDQLLQDAQAAS